MKQNKKKFFKNKNKNKIHTFSNNIFLYIINYNNMFVRIPIIFFFGILI